MSVRDHGSCQNPYIIFVLIGHNFNHYFIFPLSNSKGKALESEPCGNETGWHCSQLFSWEQADPVLPAELPEVKEEIGPGCRCGCVVHLGAAKPKRMLATSSHSCPGVKPTMWLIKASIEGNHEKMLSL